MPTRTRMNHDRLRDLRQQRKITFPFAESIGTDAVEPCLGEAERAGPTVSGSALAPTVTEHPAQLVAEGE